ELLRDRTRPGVFHFLDRFDPCLATDRTVRVRNDREFLEPHFERVVVEQSPVETLADIHEVFDRLGGLNRADDARQHAEYTGGSAVRYCAGGWSFGEQTPITGRSL